MTTKFLLSSDDNTRSGLLKKKIIHYYMANGDATIAEVCKEMNLSIPTVTKLISELQEDGYILDFGKQETSGGRKPSIYGLNPVSGYFVGVDILKDQLNLAILDFKGDKIRIEQNIPYTLENTPAALDHLCECINEFINSLPIPREKILSIGINISGRVNPFAGYSYSIFYFEEKPLSQILEEKLHIKIYIENDTRSMAYPENLGTSTSSRMRFFAIAVKKDASRLELPVLPYTVPSLSGIKRVATPYWPVKSMPGNTSGSLT